jgi:hypothetical protein
VGTRCSTLEVMDIQSVVEDIADGLKQIDASVQLCLSNNSSRELDLTGTLTMWTPDLFIRGHWALEIKLARPFWR